MLGRIIVVIMLALTARANPHEQWARWLPSGVAGEALLYDTNNIVLWWKYNTGSSGAYQPDFSPSQANYGTQSVSTIRGVVTNDFLDLTASSSGVSSMLNTNASLLNGTIAFSISMWIFPKADSGAIMAYFMSRSTGTVRLNGMWGNVGMTNVFSGNSAQFSPIGLLTKPISNDWNHICMSWTTNNGAMLLGLNGNYTNVTATGSGLQPAVINDYWRLSQDAGSRRFLGYVDDTRLANTNWTQTQFEAIRAEGRQ